MTNKKVDFNVCKEFREDLKEDLRELKETVAAKFYKLENNDLHEVNSKIDKNTKAINDLTSEFKNFMTKVVTTIGIVGSVASVVGTIFVQIVLKWLGL